MVALFERLGGTLRLDDPVVAIEVEDGRAKAVRTRSGWRGEADAVATNGDVVHSYGLIEGSPRGPRQVKALKRKRYSPSLFVLHLGLEGTFPDIPHHSILFGPRYKGLLGDIYDRGRLAPDPALYLHHPTATDPSMAPPGCSTFYALAPVPHMGRAPVDWDRDGEAYAETILDTLEARLMPDIRSRIRTRFHYAPTDFGRDLGAHLGSAFSLEPILTQSAWFRTHNRDDRDPQPLFRRRRHPSRRGNPRRRRKRRGHRRIDARMTDDRAGWSKKPRRSSRTARRASASPARFSICKTRERSWLLYAWCRACDDVTDGQTLGHDAVTPENPQERIAFLKQKTAAALAGKTTGLAAFDAFGLVARECAIPARPACRPPRRLRPRRQRLAPGERRGIAQLLLPGRRSGRRNDGPCHGGRPQTDRDTLDRAADLGIAFQLANIARDIVEDAKVGRTYLPADWLAEEGLAGADLADPAHRQASRGSPSASPRWPRITADRARSAPPACPSAAAGRCFRQPEFTAKSRPAP